MFRQSPSGRDSGGDHAAWCVSLFVSEALDMIRKADLPPLRIRRSSAHYIHCRRVLFRVTATLVRYSHVPILTLRHGSCDIANHRNRV